MASPSTTTPGRRSSRLHASGSPTTSAARSGWSCVAILGPPQLTSVWPYEADIPSSTQWNAGVQMTLPWATAVDVSYVGQHGFNQLREIRGQTQVDINAVD